MDQNYFGKLTTAELDTYCTELDNACENHYAWLAEINRTLVCRIPPNEKDLKKDAHRHCFFGRWYQGVENPNITSNDHFKKLGEVHERMHQIAREILIESQQGDDVTVEEYDSLAKATKALRHEAIALRNHIQADSALSAKILSEFFETASEGVVVTDIHGTILSVNSAFRDITGYCDDELIGNNPSLFSSGMHDPEFFDGMWYSLNTEGFWVGEIWNRRKDGKLNLEKLTITAVRDAEEHIINFIGVYADITNERESIERIQYLAHYDQLTGLPNRVLLHDRIVSALAYAKRSNRKIALLFIDLDGFKTVNDQQGHTVGDLLLKEVGKRLLEKIRGSDTVARLGGDEFVLVLDGFVSRDDVENTANKIISTIAQPYFIEGVELHITASIGISLYPDDSDNIDSLLKQADLAMYKAKRQGKNQYILFSE
ncbi:MAG: diguanylate cyclase [Gammaproteobacteria bacterium]|nr:diguanylate cyclase [Gammaproteobacteria bacterium]